MSASGRPSALLIHDDGDVLDLLTRLFESNGFEVVAATSAFRAQSHLDGARYIEVVVAPWDVSHAAGGDAYRWVLKHRADLRNRFVFLADEVPPEFDAVVGGRCLAVPLAALDDLIRVSEGIVRRVRTPPRGIPIVTDRPSLLLADDDPLLLEAAAGLFHDSGYAVTTVESGSEACIRLELRDFDALVLDWVMHDGSGADVYEWILEHKPHLAARVVFLSDDDTDSVAPGRPRFRKGQDSRALTEILRTIVNYSERRR
jgi:DNA-binding response OmpR family regulator